METYRIIDTVWIIIGTIMIFMMQPGFAMLETGMTRAKNAGNVMMKNLLDFVIGSLAFWFIGYGLLYGNGNGFIGQIDFFSTKNYDTNNIPQYVNLMYQIMFCTTAATIVSGAMAERTKFSTYLIYSFVMSALLYPIEAHWIWGNGWLTNMEFGSAKGFIDCAGGTAVHTAGGVTALVGAMLIGPRIGKYDNKKQAQAIPGHSITLATLGVFLLWFAWFGFNITSTKSISSIEKIYSAANIFLVTNISGAISAIVTLFLTWKRYNKPDVAMTLNGVIGGLVASTAGCSVVEPWAAAIIGIVAGILVIYGIELIDNVFHIDDPVGASTVHGICGIWGTLAVGLFHKEKGLFLTGDASQFIIQLLGSISVVLFVGFIMGIILIVMKKYKGLRVDQQEEIIGLDMGEHALTSAYGDFSFMQTEATQNKVLQSIQDEDADNESVKKSNMPVIDISEGVDYGKINSVVIICKESRLEALKDALNQIGVMGITVSQVMGCGVQKGQKDYYRGSQVNANLLPKLRVEIVVGKIPVELVVETARKALYTGNIGDGKIFVYQMENVIKVRTGEQGIKALQDPESYQDIE